MPKDHDRNTKPLLEARKKLSEEKYETLQTVLKDIIHSKEKVTVSRVCELSGLSKSYLYQNPRAKQLLDKAKKQTKNYPSHVSKTPEDILLQYEELRRKLQDTYLLQYQLLTDANKHLELKRQKLKEEVEQKRAEYEQKKAYWATCPNIKIFVKFHIDLKNSSVDYQIRTKYHTLNPLGPNMFFHILWGTYTIFLYGKKLELRTNVPGVTLQIEREEKEGKNKYLLIITDEVKENLVIELFIKNF